MDMPEKRLAADVVIYCPVETYFFAGYGKKEFDSLDFDDTDMLEAAKFQNGQSAWLNAIKAIAAQAEPRLAGIEVEGTQYEDIASRIIDCKLDAQMHGNRAWFVLRCVFDSRSQSDLDMALLKQYAAEQLLILDFEISPLSAVSCCGGVFVMKLCPADYYSGPNQYDIEGNKLLFHDELPGQKKEREKSSVLKQIQAAAKAPREPHGDRPARGKSGPEL
jgi:hypothetical protein